MLGLLCPLLLASLVSFVQPRPSYAQTLPPPDLRNFPLISVQVPCSGTIHSIGSDAFQLTEDGKAQVIQKVQTETVRLPVRIMIFVDLFAKAADTVGPIGDALLTLHATATATKTHLQIPQDRFAIFAPLASKTLTTIVAWTPNTVQIVNTERGLDGDNHWQPKADAPTALMALLLKTLNEFTDDGPVRRSLVVFSDGTDLENDTHLKELIAAAIAHQLPIYTILLPKQPYHDAKRLQTLAASTGGQYTDTMQLQPLWKKLLASTTLCTLTYRTRQPHPNKVVVSQVGSNPPITTVVDLPMLTLSPPDVTLAITAPEEIYPRTYRLGGNQPSTQTFDIQVTWQFQDYKQRTVKNISYRIQGATTTQTGIMSLADGASSARIQVPVVNLPLGAYLVEAMVEDEVGQLGRKSVPFGVVPTPAPTATPTASPTPTAMPTATPTATSTATPDILHRALGVPVQYPSTKMLQLLLASFTLPFWLWFIFFVIQKPTRAFIGGSPSQNTGGAKPVQALLSRENLDDKTQNEDTWRLRQIVKLTDSNKLPDCLYLKNRPANRKDELAKFKAYITQDQGEFSLLPDSNVTSIRVEGRDKKKTTDEGSIKLEDNDLIFFDKIRYRFYKIKQRDDAENGDAASALPT